MGAKVALVPAAAVNPDDIRNRAVLFLRQVHGQLEFVVRIGFKHIFLGADMMEVVVLEEDTLAGIGFVHVAGNRVQVEDLVTEDFVLVHELESALHTDQLQSVTVYHPLGLSRQGEQCGSEHAQAYSKEVFHGINSNFTARPPPGARWNGSIVPASTSMVRFR